MMAPTSIRLATQAELHGLFPEHLFHITDLALHLTTCFFDGTSVAQVWIPRRFAGLFFHFAFRFFEGALDLIFCARFHKIGRGGVGGGGGFVSAPARPDKARSAQ